MLAISLLSLLSISSVSATVSVGFYTAESAYRGYRIQDVPARYLTHLAYAFGSVNADGTVAFNDAWADTQMDPGAPTLALTATCPGGAGGNMEELWRLKVKYPHLRTLFAIGGWGETIRASFSTLTATQETRAKFISSAMEIVVNYGFDGIDIDWEFPYGQADNQQLIYLMRELREAMDLVGDDKPYALTISSTMVPKLIGGMQLKELSKSINWLNVMAYDYSVDLNTTYHDAPLYPSSKFPVPDGRSVETTVKAYLDGGMPSEKLVLGLPVYGYIYEGVEVGDKLQQSVISAAAPAPVAVDGTVAAVPAPPPSPSKAIGYGDIITKREGSAINWQEYTDDSAKSIWIYEPYAKQLITYVDTKVGLPARISFAKKFGLGGLMFWHVGFDSKNPGASFISKAVDGFIGGNPPRFKSFPVCAPTSKFCNIQTACPSNADFTGADSSAVSIFAFSRPLLVASISLCTLFLF